MKIRKHNQSWTPKSLKKKKINFLLSSISDHIMLPKGAACLLLILALSPVFAYERIYIRRDETQKQNRRSFDTASSPSPATAVFDPDVLNRFLEEYASKMKRTTERPAYEQKQTTGEHQQQQQQSVDNAKSERNNITDTDSLRHEPVRELLFYGSLNYWAIC